MASIIRGQDIKLYFDDEKTKALDGIDFEVKEGEFLAISGPSGCGKSSLLNLIGMLDVPTSGELYFRENAYSTMASDATFRQQHVGFIFQSFHLIPTLSVLENVLIPTVGRKKTAFDYNDLATHLLIRLGLTGKFDHFPGKMSGGERQRVAIARALINGPDVILADEPTGSLDSRNAVEVLALLNEFRQEQGLTLIMVTHDTNVSSCADRVIHIRDGKLDQMEKNREHA